MSLTSSVIYGVKYARNTQVIRILQKRWMSQEHFSVIRIPVQTTQRLEREKSKRKKEERNAMIERSQRGDLTVPIVSCKRKELNHYRGQSYSKFAEVPLASKGWKHLKAAGDYFTISGYSGNPSLHSSKDVSGEDFESLGLSKELLSAISQLKFEKPTNIQALAIPHVLQGKNTLVTAETGNGKTLTFLAPMLQQIAHWKRSLGSQLPFNSPLGLIISPGRELAEQIHGVASTLGESLGINVGLVLGGKIRRKMHEAKMSEIHLLVATIGALSKLTTVGVYRRDYLRHVTLDEADTLLDDSFSEKVLRYLSKLPIQGVSEEEAAMADQQPEVMSGIQLTLVAATLPRGLNTILDPLVDPDSLVHLSTPHLNRLMPHVPQRFIRVNRHTKAEKLVELVRADARRKNPVVIFSNQSKTADWISLYLNEIGVPCINLHGAMSLELRKGRFDAFQRGEAVALSCTDLTSRGLDTVQAGHVINYDFPHYIADYIHRCGRTGRVGSTVPGIVTSLVHHKNEVELVQKIEYAVRKGEAFHNVNANIKRIITNRILKEEQLRQIV